ncbi:UNVERIFIED_CONTAM: hypothetical protein Sangu_1033600 [Sesamum angustifolium]|uniref:Uncharacterized protein n=1 Tax=Sesamum angustifolium TaxID=2727405 RepID=A0AAW2NXT9_9LAMI
MTRHIKGVGLRLPPCVPPKVVDLHGLVDEGLGGEAEALLLPVGILVYLGAQNLLHQVLRVRTPYALRQRVRPIRH